MRVFGVFFYLFFNILVGCSDESSNENQNNSSPKTDKFNIPKSKTPKKEETTNDDVDKSVKKIIVIKGVDFEKMDVIVAIGFKGDKHNFYCSTFKDYLDTNYPDLKESYSESLDCDTQKKPRSRVSIELETSEQYFGNTNSSNSQWKIAATNLVSRKNGGLSLEFKLVCEIPLRWKKYKKAKCNNVSLKNYQIYLKKHDGTLVTLNSLDEKFSAPSNMKTFKQLDLFKFKKKKRNKPASLSFAISLQDLGLSGLGGFEDSGVILAIHEPEAPSTSSWVLGKQPKDGCLDSNSPSFDPNATYDSQATPAQPYTSCVYAPECQDPGTFDPTDPRDEDCDNVADLLDECPDTPEGSSTSIAGCSMAQSRDDDNDGIVNIDDLCLSSWPYTSLDENGCTPDDYLDGDGDGVANYLDACKNSPSGVSVGADGCENFAQGGLAFQDIDMDGVPDRFDECPATPPGDPVGEDGCATGEYVDNDNDGVPDHRDDCEDSLSGEVALNGCSLEDLDLDLASVNMNYTRPKIDVGRMGNLNLTYEFKFPIGTGGLTPLLMASYNQNSSNGKLGYQWSLKGLPNLGKCRNNLGIDGYIHEKNGDFDELCFNGQKMIPSKMDPLVYYLEKDNFSKLVKIPGDSGAAVVGKIVYYDVGGLIHTFFESYNGKYFLNSTEDRYGNHIQYGWLKSDSTADRLFQIQYSSNEASGIDYQYQLNFSYVEAKVPRSPQHGHHPSRIERYISGIDLVSLAKNQTVKRWDLIYNRDDLLESIEECVSDVCTKAMGLFYSNGYVANNIRVTKMDAIGRNDFEAYPGLTTINDLNRDGYLDYIYRSKDSGLLQVSYGSDYNYLQPVSAYAPDSPVNDVIEKFFLFSDLDGDGFSEHIWLNDGNAIHHAKGSARGLFWDHSSTHLADIDIRNSLDTKFFITNVGGDFKPDLIWIDESNNIVYWMENSSTLGNISFKEKKVLVSSNDNTTVYSRSGNHNFVDMNRDGRSDWVWMPETIVSSTTYTPLNKLMVQYSQLEIRKEINSPDNVIMSPRNDGRSIYIDLNGDGHIDRFWETKDENERVYYNYLLSTRDKLFYKYGQEGGVKVSATKEISYYPIDADQNGVVEVYQTDTDTPNGLITMHASYEDFRTIELYSDELKSLPWGFMQGDMNLDGVPDMIYLNESNQLESLSIARKRNLVYIRDADLREIKVGYIIPKKSEISQSSIPDTSINFAQNYVVGSIIHTHMRRNYYYQYENLYIHNNGLGNLGFSKTIRSDTQRGVSTTNYYHIDPSQYLSGLVAETHQTITSTGILLSLSSNTYETIINSDDALIPIVYTHYKKTLNEFWDLNSGNSYITNSIIRELIPNDRFGRVEKETYITRKRGRGEPSTREKQVIYEYSDPNYDTWLPIHKNKITESSQYMNNDPVIKTIEVLSSDQAGRSSKEIHLEGDLALTLSWERNGVGNITSFARSSPSLHTDVVETTTYESTGRYPHIITNSVAETTVYEYNPDFGQVIKETSPNGLTTRTRLDVFGQPSLILYPDGKYTTLESRVCDPSLYPEAKASLYSCDQIRRGFGSEAYELSTTHSGASEALSYINRRGQELRKKERLPFGEWTSTKIYYDDLGRLIKQTNAAKEGEDNGYTTMVYDMLDRVTSTTLHKVDGSEEKSTREYVEHTISTTNTLNQKRVETKDSEGNLISVIGGNGELSFEKYIYPGKPSTIIAGNAVTTYEYDIIGNPTKVIDPDLGEINRVYDALGRMVLEISADEKKTCFVYDGVGRIIKRIANYEGDDHFTACAGDSPNGKIAQWNYDEKGNLVGVINDEYSKSISYDYLSRETFTKSKFDEVTFVTGKNYDKYGRVQTQYYPAAFKASYSYDPVSGELVSINAGGKQLWGLEEVNAQGKRTQVRLGNGIIQNKEFEKDTGLVKNINYSSYLNRLKDLPRNTSYEYDGGRNLLSRKFLLNDGTAAIEKFTYDAQNQVTSFLNAENSLTSYQYDTQGNLLQNGGLTLEYQNHTCESGFAPLHGVTASQSMFNSSTGFTNYCYDKKGNQISGNDRVIDYSWFNKPVYISQQETKKFFSYGPNFEILTRRDYENDELISKHWFGDGLFERIRKDGKTIYKFFINDDVTITKEADDSLTEMYSHRDALGSIVANSNALGETIASHYYNPWGKKISYDFVVQGEIDEQRGFTGHQHFSDVSVVHMNGRIYDPSLGRMLNPDPMTTYPKDIGNYNRFTYVLNNPLNLTDPSGFSIWDDISDGFERFGNAFKTIGEWIGGGLVTFFSETIPAAFSDPTVQRALSIAFSVLKIVIGIATIATGSLSVIGILAGIAGVYDIITGVDELQAEIRNDIPVLRKAILATGLSETAASYVSIGLDIGVNLVLGFPAAIQKAGYKYSSVGKSILHRAPKPIVPLTKFQKINPFKIYTKYSSKLRKNLFNRFSRVQPPIRLTRKNPFLKIYTKGSFTKFNLYFINSLKYLDKTSGRLSPEHLY